MVSCAISSASNASPTSRRSAWQRDRYSSRKKDSKSRASETASIGRVASRIPEHEPLRHRGRYEASAWACPTSRQAVASTRDDLAGHVGVERAVVLGRALRNLERGRHDLPGLDRAGRQVEVVDREVVLAVALVAHLD